MNDVAGTPHCGFHRVPAVFMLLGAALLTMTTTACALFGGREPAPYVPPPKDLPLSFEEPDVNDPWTQRVSVDSKLVTDLRAQRMLYLKGKRLRTENVSVELVESKARRAVATFSLRQKGMEQLEPDTYAQKLILEARWLSEPDSNPPLHIERWSYFVVDEGRVRIISMKEYSERTDPTEEVLTEDGKKRFVHRGGGIKAEIPLPETKSVRAIRMGPRSGLVQEKVGRQQLRDKSEARER